MYTEIKEAVNFLTAPLFGRLPRRKVISLAEILGNLLIQRFKKGWTDEADKCLHLLALRMQTRHPSGNDTFVVKTDGDVINAAKICGIDVDDLKCLPENTMMHLGPGEVYISVYEPPSSSRYHHNHKEARGASPTRSTTHKVWEGNPATADDNYNPLPAKVSRALEEASAASGAAGDSVLHHGPGNGLPDNYVPLKLEQIPIEGNLLASELGFVAANARDHADYTVESFSVTRFGSHRARPDHETMKRIQRQAAIEAVSKTAPGLLVSAGLGDSGAPSSGILSPNDSFSTHSDREGAPIAAPGVPSWSPPSPPFGSSAPLSLISGSRVMMRDSGMTVHPSTTTHLNYGAPRGGGGGMGNRGGSQYTQYASSAHRNSHNGGGLGLGGGHMGGGGGGMGGGHHHHFHHGAVPQYHQLGQQQPQHGNQEIFRSMTPEQRAAVAELVNSARIGNNVDSVVNALLGCSVSGPGAGAEMGGGEGGVRRSPLMGPMAPLTGGGGSSSLITPSSLSIPSPLMAPPNAFAYFPTYH